MSLSSASVHTEDNFKWTPLHFACIGGQQDVVELLLEKGANLEAVTVNGGTPLMRAVESANPALVQYLIDRGAKVQAENKKGTWQRVIPFVYAKISREMLKLPFLQENIGFFCSYFRPNCNGGGDCICRRACLRVRARKIRHLTATQ